MVINRSDYGTVKTECTNNEVLKHESVFQQTLGEVWYQIPSAQKHQASVLDTKLYQFTSYLTVFAADILTKRTT